MPRPRKSDKDRGVAQRDLMRARRAEAADVKIPKCKNPKRRKAAEKSAYLWTRTYLSNGLYLQDSETHIEVYGRIERCIRLGRMEAMAMERGFGKDTIVVNVMLWAICTGIIKVALLVVDSGRTAGKRMRSIKETFETNDLLMQDYPEVCAPIRALEGAPQRASAQTVKGKRTRMYWGTVEIRLPVITGSKASSGTIVAVGIDGPIRGMQRSVLAYKGKKLVQNLGRIDFYFITDPETDESVKSDIMTKDIEDKIDNGIGGTGGPGLSVAGVIACTILKKGCAADKYTTPTIKPAWNGHRYPSVIQWPERMDMWENYCELRKNGMARGDDPDGREAHDYYLANREEMDRGTKVTWPYRFISKVLPDGTNSEVSAIQNRFNVLCDKGESYFATEYQQDPLVAENEVDPLTSQAIGARLSNVPKQVVPAGFEKLVEFIDVGARRIHFVVMAVKMDCTATVVDYSTRATNAPDTALSTGAPVAVQKALEHAILETLHARRLEVMHFPYRDEEGDAVQVDLHLVDAGYAGISGGDVIDRFISESGPKWRAVKGQGTAPKMERYYEPKPGKHMRIGHHYYASLQGNGRWRFLVDTDHWKHFLHQRLTQDVNTQGALTLFGADSAAHKWFIRHILSERWNVEKSRWELIGGQNHYLDCLVGCNVAGAMLGARLLTEERIVPSKRATPRSVVESGPNWLDGGTVSTW